MMGKLPHHSPSESVEDGCLDEMGSWNLTRLAYRVVVSACTGLFLGELDWQLELALLMLELDPRSPSKQVSDDQLR
ncbi:hypothetical protein TNCV_1080221 [Trichonephila clavipes]|nr:hypothetical protein TNCV_1080221 [Trichonephila clavipes]